MCCDQAAAVAERRLTLSSGEASLTGEQDFISKLSSDEHRPTGGEVEIRSPVPAKIRLAGAEAQPYWTFKEDSTKRGTTLINRMMPSLQIIFYFAALRRSARIATFSATFAFVSG